MPRYTYDDLMAIRKSMPSFAVSKAEDDAYDSGDESRKCSLLRKRINEESKRCENLIGVLKVSKEKRLQIRRDLEKELNTLLLVNKSLENKIAEEKITEEEAKKISSESPFVVKARPSSKKTKPRVSLIMKEFSASEALFKSFNITEDQKAAFRDQQANFNTVSSFTERNGSISPFRALELVKGGFSLPQHHVFLAKQSASFCRSCTQVTEQEMFYFCVECNEKIKEEKRAVLVDHRKHFRAFERRNNIPKGTVEYLCCIHKE